MSPLLYGFLSVVKSITVPQKYQYWPKLGSVSKDRPLKSRTSSIAANRTYTKIPVPSHRFRSSDSPTNRTTATSKIFWLYVLFFPFQFWLFSFSPLFGQYSSNNAIICLHLTRVLPVWKSEKCLTKRLKLKRIQVWNFAMTFYPLVHQQSWQATPEPITGFIQCGLSWISLCANAHNSFSATSVNFGVVVTNGFFNPECLFVIEWYM